MTEGSSDKEFDVIIFGASGITGAYVVEELAKVAKKENVKWAISGRNKAKLQNVLKEAVQNTGLPKGDLEYIPIVVADVADQSSLEAMAKKAKIVLNCVGPYNFFGAQVVEACLNNKTHHLDVSGEPQFLESMLLKHHKNAEDAGVYVIGTCGFDSIPCDMGMTYLKQNFQGDLNTVETFLSFKSDGEKRKQINYGTWQSAIHGVSRIFEMKALRKKINEAVFTKPLPKKNYPIKKRFPLSKFGDGWCLPFLGSDKTVCVRTQLYNYQKFSERPTQIQTYFKVSSFLMSILTIMVVSLFAPLCFFRFGRALLERFPEFFSLGYFHKGGPTKEEVQNDSFTIELYGEGWNEKLSETTDLHTDAPNKKAKVIVNGPDPAYVTTSLCMVQAALCVLKEKDKMPFNGGVLTPGSAFANTSLISRLNQEGLIFKYYNL